MALSGYLDAVVETNWRLVGEWTATQDLATNTSTITLKVYWQGLNGKGAISDRGTKTGYTLIDGVETSFQATATLSNGQKKLIHTRVYNAKHDAAGKFEDLDIELYFDVETDLGPYYYGSIQTLEYFDLNPIPRESGLGSKPYWDAGQDTTLTVQQYSTSYTHKLRITVHDEVNNDIPVKTLSFPNTSQASLNTAFTAAENLIIFNTLNGRELMGSHLYLETWSGSTLIGTKDYIGAVYAPKPTKPVIDGSFIIGDAFTVGLPRSLPSLTHVVRLKNGTTVLKEYPNTGKPAAVADTLVFETSDIKDALLALIPNLPSIDLKLEVVTQFQNRSVYLPETVTITAVAAALPPVFAGEPLHKDTNLVTKGVTGNDQYIVSKKSVVQVILPAAMRATPSTGTTMKEYVATLAGKTVVKPWASSGDVVFDFGIIQASVDQVLTIKAVDSRGQTLEISKSIPVVPYDNPGITTSAGRDQGYDHDTHMKLAGTLSSVEVAGVNKNSLVTARYRTRELPSGAWSGYTNFATAGFPSFTATDSTKYLDRAYAFQVEFQVSDRIATTTVLRTVGAGQPIMMIDDRLGSVGFGDFPTLPNTIFMNMQLRFGASKFASAGGGIHMNNSDILGLNQLIFNDHTHNDGEGLMFPKSTFVSTPEKPYAATAADRDVLRVSDGTLLLNSRAVMMPQKTTGTWTGNWSRVVWEGAAYPNPDPYIINLGRNLMDFPNGLILCWSEYVVGSGEVDAGWQFSTIPKEIYPIPGTGVKIPLMTAANLLIYKYLYFNIDNIQAHSSASTGDNRGMVLRYVVGF